MYKAVHTLVALLLSAVALGQQGQEIYQNNCTQCHGDDGSGGIGPALADNQELQDTQHVINQIQTGGGGMPAFGDQLSNEQIAAVASHIRTSWGNSFGQIRAQQVGNNQDEQQEQQQQQEQEQQQQQEQEQQGRKQDFERQEQQEQPPSPQIGGAMTGGAMTGGAGQLPAQPVSDSPTQEELNSAAESTDSWLMYNKGYDGQRYSTLDQINTTNVEDLQPVCAFQTGEAEVAFQASPIIYEGLVYVTTPENTYALNAKTCERVWKHTYTPTGPEPFPTNRGVAIAGGRVFRGTTDGHFLALDAKTGKLLWDIQPVDSSIGYWLSSAPIVWNDLVFTGTAGADWGAPAKLFAFDVETGKQVWMFDQIVPETFGGAEAASTGGGSNWTSYALDEETGELYTPVGNPAPDFACGYRPGDNLYTNSVIVNDAMTGELKRWYQQIPQDCHDWDTAAAPILFELNGSRHMAVASKNGLLYVYNDERAAEIADSGEGGVQQSNIEPPQQNQPQQSHGDTLIYAAETTTRENVTTNPTVEGVHICPGVVGGTEWYGPVFRPEGNTIYTNSVDWCATYTLGEARYTPGELFFGGDYSFDPVAQSGGWLRAFDAQSGQKLWEYRSDRPLVAALTPTAGGLIFTGELSNDFIALDATTGEVRYRFNTGGPVAAGISTYELDGKQYVAVGSGNFSRTWNPDTGASATVFIFALPY